MHTRLRIQVGGAILDAVTDERYGKVAVVSTDDGGYVYEATSTDGTTKATGFSPLNTAYRMLESMGASQ